MSKHPEKLELLHHPDAGKSEPLWTKSFIMLTFCYFLLFLCLQMLLSPFPTYAKDRFHSGDFTLSLLTSLFAISAIITRFVTAALMRRVHRNTLLFCGVAFAAVSTAAYSFAGSMGMLLALRVCFGIGFGMASTVMPTLVSQIIPRRRIGEGVGYFGLSSSLAMSVGPTIGLAMIGSYGFAPLTAMGTAAAALIVPLLLGSRSIPPQPAAAAVSPAGMAADGQAHGSAGGAVKRSRFNKKLLLPALLNALLSVTYGGLLSFIALYGKEVHLEQIGLFFLFNAITVLVVRPISGRLFDSKGHAAILIPGALILIASLLVLSVATTMPVLIVSALLYGLGFGALQPTTQAWMLRETPPEQHGTTNSLFYNSIDFGVAVGSMLLGLVASGTSYAVMYRYAAGVMVLFLLVYAVYMLTRRRNSGASAIPAVTEMEVTS
ncbi:MFS transporter [Paenibacillus sp. UNC499MF]|uniref:MFS transporter n=1 Tax=Paenibacillus sp. UNC499MF TaxID=1502751 RepID=UPI00089FE2AB|nr:MFS transporter [Paenibacillus sp. UNC499MF]SEG08070.1 Predicted arabinose efflux permease, MFS family [Paenibacillus sp. UNC499MF]